jgi:hypothetical protein
MISPEVLIEAFIIAYGAIGVLNILFGAFGVKRTVREVFGPTEVIYGLILLGLAIAAWVI